MTQYCMNESNYFSAQPLGAGERYWLFPREAKRGNEREKKRGVTAKIRYHIFDSSHRRMHSAKTYSLILA